MLEDHRELYNAALQERRGAYESRRITVRYGDQSVQLKEVRALRPEHARWSFSSQQATLRRLDKAFAAFFRRARANQRPGYPRFRGRTWDGRSWHVVLSCEMDRPAPLPKTGRQVGVDLGVASFLTTGDGVHFPNPRHAAASAARLAKAQQALARCKRGSNRRTKARARVAALHRTIRCQRLDHAHKTALELVRTHDLIAYERLAIDNMVRAPRPKPDPEVDDGYLPNRRAAKAGLNRAILDAGGGVFLTILIAKAESAGRTMVAVDPRNTSRTCPRCRHVAKENRVTQETFRCVGCGYTAHADVVGASNVLRAGLARRDAAAAA